MTDDDRDDDDDDERRRGDEDVLQVAAFDVRLHTVKATRAGPIDAVKSAPHAHPIPFTRPSVVTCATRSPAHPMLAASARRAR